jgi:hypothetical protein
MAINLRFWWTIRRLQGKKCFGHNHFPSMWNNGVNHQKSWHCWAVKKICFLDWVYQFFWCPHWQTNEHFILLVLLQQTRTEFDDVVKRLMFCSPKIRKMLWKLSRKGWNCTYKLMENEILTSWSPDCSHGDCRECPIQTRPALWVCSLLYVHIQILYEDACVQVFSASCST